MTEEQLKLALKDSPFKTVFKATIAFYLAQTLITVIGIAMFVSVFVVMFMVLK